MKRASIVDHKAIGLRLAALRRTHGLQASQAAAKAGVNTRSWRKWERGGQFNTSSFLKICRAFHCSGDWLALGRPFGRTKT